MMRARSWLASCSDVSVEHPVEDQVVGLRGLELGSHVAGAVNSAEGESTLVLLPVASDLALDQVLLPLAGLVPVERGDPVLGADGGHGTIGVARVVQHLGLAGEGLVDPLGGLRLRNVLNAGLAEIPSLNVLRDVHGFAHGIRVHVVEEGRAESARRQLVEIGALAALADPGGVVSLAHVGLVVALLRLVEVGEGGTLGLRVRAGAPAGAEDVIDVDGLSEGVELAEEVHALVADVEHEGHVPVAIELDELLVHLLANEGVPVAHVDVAGRRVILPVGDTVADGETLQVGLEDAVVSGVLLVVLVDIVREVGNVDASIGLTRDVKLVVLVLRELREPLEDDSEVILTTLLVIEGAVLSVVTVGVADTSGLLDVEQVGLTVPGELALVELVAARLDAEGTVLLHEAEHGRAAGATVEPDKHGGVLGVVLGLEEQVVDLLGRLSDVEIAREGTELVEGAHIGER
uniref:Uncharacterized protein n=1 Tax=Favella ehrenbergii TaxID=182087 RepID=A0A7S3HWM2_9SPIT|mmetsp:Transcript_16180/g.20539  ORF Transcript_16180/g.20539 Transcript_16180/m.20539 type:complete len:462 (+) Transcript_16180:132-1517(+)